MTVPRKEEGGWGRRVCGVYGCGRCMQMQQLLRSAQAEHVLMSVSQTNQAPHMQHRGMHDT